MLTLHMFFHSRRIIWDDESDQVLHVLLTSVENLQYVYMCTHFKGKRNCISGIIELLSVLRNALSRNGGSICDWILETTIQITH